MWRRTLIESTAIILSILLAFAIDAGWDAFKERKQERVFLESLLSDFEEARGSIEESNETHANFIASARRLLALHGRARFLMPPNIFQVSGRQTTMCFDRIHFSIILSRFAY